MVSYPVLNPKSIVVVRDYRQRRSLKVDDLVVSIKTIGIINPIIVAIGADNKIRLIAGERRLQAALDLGLTEVPVRYFNDLSPIDRQIVELEENVKRQDLPWQDLAKAYERIHELYREKDPAWKIEQTANAVGISSLSYLTRALHVAANLSSGKLESATGIDNAYNILSHLAERKAEAIVSELITGAGKIFSDNEVQSASSPEAATGAPVGGGGPLPPPGSTASHEQVPVAAPKDPVLCADFTQWIKSYSGKKFNLIHCDFPYGNYKGDDSAAAQSKTESEDFYDNTEDVYWNLLKALTDDLDKIMSYTAHMVFWFNMNFYGETKRRLEATGLTVHEHPLIWFKSDGRGVVPGNAVTHPRRVYDTAFLCVRGNRLFANPGSNGYAAPTVQNKIHPSQKPEPMLRHFLSMLIDETTTFLDPTCGSAASLRAAEDLGAASVLGLELDAAHARAANAATLRARLLRQANRSVQEA